MMYKENKIAACVVFAIFAAALVKSMTIPQAAKIFPAVTCILGMLFAVILLTHTCINEKKGIPVARSKKNSKVETVKIILAFFAILAYIILIPVIGWCVSSLLFMSGISLYYGKPDQNRLRTVGISAGVVLIFYILFVVAMKTTLPRGLLF